MGAITDVPGITVGQAQDEEALTGCTVVLCPQGATAGVDVRGSAPGTRETDLLNPVNVVQQIHGLTLCGGSAFGLAAAGGVMTWLREHGHGLPTAHGLVPLVPAAVIYDLGVGDANRYPDAITGYAACELAGTAVEEGNFGAGAGASIGKILGKDYSIKAGVGTASTTFKFTAPNQTATQEYIIGALVVTNAFGDVYDDKGQLVGGIYDRREGKLLDSVKLIRAGNFQPRSSITQPPETTNTTIAIVATNAPLNKVACQKIAQMAQNGLARAIRPAHTMFDGDTVFALSTSPADVAQVNPFLLSIVGELAAETLAEAIVRSVLMATPAGGLPSVKSFATKNAVKDSNS